MSTSTRRVYASILATSAMTVIGYLYSVVSRVNVAEPVLLSKLIRQCIPGINPTTAAGFGWLSHYAVGLLFTEMYLAFWSQVPEETKVESGFVFGAIGGLGAILIWRVTFALHPDPPDLNFLQFAINLFIGHLVFGIVSALTVSSSLSRHQASGQ